MISNCFIYAIIQKIKNPKNRKIIKIDKVFSSFKFPKVPHYVIYDKEENKIYSFEMNKESTFFLPLFKGNIVTYTKEEFEIKMFRQINALINHTKENYILKYTSNPDKTDSHYAIDSKPSIEDGLPFTKDVPYVEIYYEDKGIPVHTFYRLNEKGETNLPENVITWNYVSPSADYYRLKKLNKKNH